MTRRSIHTVATLLAATVLAACGGPVGNTDPGPPPGGGAPVQVSAGAFFSMALTDGGHAFAWGWNLHGGLGIGTGEDRATPAVVAAPDGVRFTQVAAGGLHAVALADDGRVFAWGRNTFGAVGDGMNSDRLAPRAIAVPTDATVVAVAAGGEFSLALTDAGHVYAWGANSSRQLGDGTTTTRTAPVAVQVLGDPTFVAIDAGGDHVLALTDDGQVFAWGANNEGQLGDGTTDTRSLPQAVALPGDPTVIGIAAGSEFSLALTEDGTAYAWGLNFSGALGDGTTTRRLQPVAVALPEGPTFVEVVAGGQHALARTSAGELVAWGNNGQGQLGDGTTDARSLPGPVTAPAGTRFVAVDANGSHVLALTDAGDLVAWGWNARGQLGDGTTSNRALPVVVPIPGNP